MKKKNIKKYFILAMIATVSAGLLLATTKIGVKKQYPTDENRLQILFFGDSNIANASEGKTIPERVAEYIECDAYNCAVGGTTAAKINNADYFDHTADLFCLYNISKIMEIEEYQALLDFYDTMPVNEQMAIEKVDMLTQIKYEEIDYVIISYGVNDYTAGIPADSEEPFEENTYEGALRKSVERIQKMCPDSTIIISSITYCSYTGEEDNKKDGYEYDWGGGYINEYRDAAKRVASEYSNVIFMDNLELLDINASNYNQYLSDGIHFSAMGQKMYTDCLVSIIQENENNKDE